MTALPLFVYLVLASDILLGDGVTIATSDAILGWHAKSPRDEIRPAFSTTPAGGPSNSGCLVITHDGREGLDGWFQKGFDVVGGESYRFHAARKAYNVANERRSLLVRILWHDAAGKMVSADVPESQAKELGHVPTAEPEHPVGQRRLAIRTGPQRSSGHR